VHWARYLKEVTSFEFVPPDSPDPAAYVVEHGVGIIGTPDDAIRHIEQIHQGTGGFGVHLDFAHNWADWENTKRSYELFARYVIPHFRGTLRSRRASYDFCIDNREGFAAATTQAVQAANRIASHKPD
jgi:limonene 1,2-monooxygenase